MLIRSLSLAACVLAGGAASAQAPARPAPPVQTRESTSSAGLRLRSAMSGSRKSRTATEAAMPRSGSFA